MPMQIGEVHNTLQELISLNYHFDRMKQQDRLIEKKHKMERCLYSLINVIYWVFVPL